MVVYQCFNQSNSAHRSIHYSSRTNSIAMQDVPKVSPIQTDAVQRHTEQGLSLLMGKRRRGNQMPFGGNSFSRWGKECGVRALFRESGEDERRSFSSLKAPCHTVSGEYCKFCLPCLLVKLSGEFLRRVDAVYTKFVFLSISVMHSCSWHDSLRSHMKQLEKQWYVKVSYQVTTRKEGARARYIISSATC